MLFNSFEFICLFLPTTLLVFFALGKMRKYQLAIGLLVLVSLFFYGWWNPAYLGLLTFSLLSNYGCGSALGRFSEPVFSKKLLLTFGIAVNLSLIGYYKYANFFIDNLDHLLRTDFVLQSVVLPLGISFYTFQQIAYLVDAYKGETKEYNFVNYSLFVTFFPQLIAGPIIHHKEVMPQFANPANYRLNSQDLAIGLTTFSIGLAKKVFLADTFALSATPVFEAAASGVTLTFFESWTGALAYTLQLYFDFSGYSDMAIGAARMFGIKLPMNFNSPYKSISITEFWRRWHITLSNFLRDYLYIPLGGNRKGKIRRYMNLMITMLLGGLWHGAGWTFIFWGGLHGAYLVINHGWNSYQKSLGIQLEKIWWTRLIGVAITFIAVVLSWVFFRADSMATAGTIVSSMIGFHGFSAATNLPISKKIVVLGLGCVFLLPNTQQWLGRYKPALNYQDDRGSNSIWDKWLHRLQWRPNLLMSMVVSSIAFFSILKAVSVVRSEFLYFDF